MRWSLPTPAAASTPPLPARFRRRLTVVGGLGLLALLATLPLSPPEGAGPQWDNLVLAVATAASLVVGGLERFRRTGLAQLTALVATAGTVLLVVACALTATGGTFGHRGLPDVLLPVASMVPLAVCALLASEVSGTRWRLLAVDAVAASLAASVPVTVFVAGPAHRSGSLAAATADVVTGAGYGAAVTVGVAAALCTVAAAGTRRAATAQLVATLWFALGAAGLAFTLAFPSRWSQGASDVSVLVGVLFAQAAVALAPASRLGDGCRRPRVLAPGQTTTLVALASAPLALLAGVLTGAPLTAAALLPAAASALLMVHRRGWLARDGQRLRDDLLSHDADVRELMRSVAVEVALVDRDLRLVVVSPAARVLLGLAGQDADGADPVELLPRVAPADRARVAAALRAPEPGTVRFAVPHRTGGPVQLEGVVRPGAGSDRRVLQLRDVTSDRARERELERLAFSDPLTGLPNRALLGDALARGAEATRHVLLLDLDGFKDVNDSAGHEAGDLVLVEVAHRLERSVPREALVARLGGDEFVVVVPGDLATATGTAQHLVEVLAAPYRLAAGTFLVSASIGIALAPSGGGSTALRDADESLRWAKAAGKSCWRVHTGHPSAPAPAGDLLAALAEGRLRVEYSVLSDPAAGRVVGLEATPVWDHADLGVLPAAEVWAAAERQGAHRELRQWLIGRACADVAPLPAHVHVGVPLAPTAAHGDTLVEDVTAALAGSGLAASRLALSVTEEVLQRAPATLQPALHRLHDRGVHLALTDYGLGLTLWSHLTRVPVDAVVVSLRTLAGTGNAQHAVRVLRGIVETAAAVGVRSIIADVEDPRVLASITSLGALAMSGPLVPGGLTAGQAAALLGDGVREPVHPA
jgi:diguanylate cyclase (GGDEF)-like protein